MKYTTKSGLELPPEVVEVIEQLKKQYGTDICPAFGLYWRPIPDNIDKALTAIWYHDDFTEFYKLYPKKDLDSYGNEIVKGEMVEVRDTEKVEWNKREFVVYCSKRVGGGFKYLTYEKDYGGVTFWKYCRKINSNEVKKSELQSQMNEFLKQAKEIEAKINEL